MNIGFQAFLLHCDIFGTLTVSQVQKSEALIVRRYLKKIVGVDNSIGIFWLWNFRPSAFPFLQIFTAILAHWKGHIFSVDILWIQNGIGHRGILWCWSCDIYFSVKTGIVTVNF